MNNGPFFRVANKSVCSLVLKIFTQVPNYTRYYATREPFVSVYLAPRPALLIRDPKIAKDIIQLL